MPDEDPKKTSATMASTTAPTWPASSPPAATAPGTARGGTGRHPQGLPRLRPGQRPGHQLRHRQSHRPGRGRRLRPDQHEPGRWAARPGAHRRGRRCPVQRQPVHHRRRERRPCARQLPGVGWHGDRGLGPGAQGHLPASSAEADDIAAPYGSDKADFIASFSNVGPETDLTGPGVGIMSTFPGGYAEISGTSMACPRSHGSGCSGPCLLGRPEDQAGLRPFSRHRHWPCGVRPLLGFQPTFEGHGLPEPQ